MIDFAIDCPLFLRLINEPLGNIDIYRITTNGVITTFTERDFESDRSNAQLNAGALAFVQNANLPFPTTAQRLLPWMMRDADMEYLFPTWLEPIIVARNVESARAVLAEVAVDIDARIKVQESKVKRIAAQSGQRGEEFVAKRDLEELLGKRAAIDLAAAALQAHAIQDKQVAAVPKLQRSNLMSIEIDAAKNAIGTDATPSQVMVWLKQQKGKTGSCVTGAIDGDVEWKDGAGAKQILTMKSLRERMRRAKATLAPR